MQVRHTLIGRSVLWKQKHIKDCSQLAKKQGSLQKYSAEVTKSVLWKIRERRDNPYMSDNYCNNTWILFPLFLSIRPCGRFLFKRCSHSVPDLTIQKQQNLIFFKTSTLHEACTYQKTKPCITEHIWSFGGCGLFWRLHNKRD